DMAQLSSAETVGLGTGSGGRGGAVSGLVDAIRRKGPGARSSGETRTRACAPVECHRFAVTSTAAPPWHGPASYAVQRFRQLCEALDAWLAGSSLSRD